MGQKLRVGGTGAEALTVRWANDDPNPVAIMRVKREREDTVVDAIQRAEQKLPPEQRLAMQQMRQMTRTRTSTAEDGDESEEEAFDPQAYPDTDAQYGSGGGAGLGEASAGGVVDLDYGTATGISGRASADREGANETETGAATTVAAAVAHHMMANGEEAGNIAAAVGLHPDAALLGAQQAAYHAFIGAGGDPAAWDPVAFAAVMAAPGQGLTLVNFSAQLKRILWDRGAFRGCLGGV